MDSSSCRASGFTKAFGENTVLRGLNLDQPADQVPALMGANEAGKSTLVKILSGALRCEEGLVELRGHPFEPTSAADAIRQGIVTIHKSIDDAVIADLDVASNLMIDRLAERGYGFLLRRRRLNETARAIANRMGLDVDARKPVSDLGVADRQLVAIARAMAGAVRLMRTSLRKHGNAVPWVRRADATQQARRCV